MTCPNCPIRRHMVLTVQISVENIDLDDEKCLNTHTLSLSLSLS